MIKVAACVFAACAWLPAVAGASTVELYETKGCLQKDTHAKRLAWTAIAMRAAQQRAAGKLIPEMAAAADRATELVVETTRSDCRTLNGEYKVLERATVDGGVKLQRVRVSAKESLWVLAD